MPGGLTMLVDPLERACTVCGCTAENACFDPQANLPCSWLSDDIDVCTACVIVAPAPDCEVCSGRGVIEGRLPGAIDGFVTVASCDCWGIGTRPPKIRPELQGFSIEAFPNPRD